MGKNSDRERQRQLEQQAAADRASRDALIATASQPRPLEQAYDTERLNWLNATGGKDGPIDVTKLPGMGPSYGLYDAASKRQQGERMGIGALGFGAQNTNPGLGQLLRQQSEDQRQQEASGQFENAYRMKDAEMRGSVLPLLGLQQNRTMGLASLGSGNASNSASLYSNFRPATPFWQSLLINGLQGASQVASAKVAVGCVALDTRILTPHGYVEIGNLNEGDLVIGINRKGTKLALPIVRKRLTPESDILRINDALECSPSDRIMASADDHSEKFASELAIGDKVDGMTIESIEKLPAKKPVVIIKLGSQSENYGFRDNAGFLHLDDYAVKGASA